MLSSLPAPLQAPWPALGISPWRVRTIVPRLGAVTVSEGYLNLFKWRGVPVRVHWTMPLGALFFSGFRFDLGFFLGFFLLILVHEAGHAIAVRRYGHRVYSVEVTGFGGLCRWAGHATPYERGVIAWGGVLAQGALLITTIVALLVFGLPSVGVLGTLAYVFINTNLWLIALNLLPFPPLDGAEAWKLLPAIFQGWRQRHHKGHKRNPREPLPRKPLPRRGWWPRQPVSRDARKPEPREPARPGQVPKEVADLLRQVAEEARQARQSTNQDPKDRPN